MLDRTQILYKIAKIPGWLAEPAAIFTLHLLETFKRQDIHGPMLEIGVYKGKFLALLRSVSDQKLVGIELCPDGHENNAVQQIIENVVAAAGHADELDIVAADSRTLSSADLLRMLGGRPALIHIDGGHDVETVFHDLSISAP